MIVQQVKCPSCGGPQESKLVKHGEWNCEYCGDHLIYKSDVVEVIPATVQNINTNKCNTKETKPTVPENSLFTAVSIIYQVSFFVAIMALFFINTNTVIWYFTLATNIYIAICGFAAAVSSEKTSPSISDPTMSAVLVWIIYNIILMIFGFPMAIVIRIVATLAYFIVGVVIGILFSGGAVSVEVKKVEKID